MNPAIDLELQERRLRQAMLDGDVEVLAQPLSDGLIFTNQDGVRPTKESDLATHRSRTLTIEALNTVGEPTVRLLGDVAIVFTVAELAVSLPRPSPHSIVVAKGDGAPWPMKMGTTRSP